LVFLLVKIRKNSTVKSKIGKAKKVIKNLTVRFTAKNQSKTQKFQRIHQELNG